MAIILVKKVYIFFVIFTSFLPSTYICKNLTNLEYLAELIAPKSVLENNPFIFKSSIIHQNPSKELLCAIFLKASKVQIDILRTNIKTVGNRCEWAFLI